MNCTICGKATMPGAMLCGPCKAALKRARYVTVQDDIRRSSIIDVRRKPRRQASSALAPAVATAAAPILEPGPLQRPPAPVAASSRLLGRRICVGVFIAALAIGGATYFGQRELGARAQDTPAVPLPRDLSLPALDSAEKVVATAPTTAELAPPQPAPAEARIAGADAVTEHGAASKAVAPAKRAAPHAAASFATANGDPPEATPPPPPIPEKVAALPVAPQPAVPDRWQSMRDAIAACDRENLINGIICGQKARIQYCEGYWGKVPQCPGPTANPER